jgi:hypothetical protein
LESAREWLTLGSSSVDEGEESGVKKIAAAAIAVGGLIVGASSAAAPNAVYPNCTAMHHRYRHGVGKVGAHDHTSGVPVTNFYRSNRLYFLNRHLDRDKDGIACEKH